LHSRSHSEQKNSKEFLCIYYFPYKWLCWYLFLFQVISTVLFHSTSLWLLRISTQQTLSHHLYYLRNLFYRPSPGGEGGDMWDGSCMGSGGRVARLWFASVSAVFMCVTCHIYTCDTNHLYVGHEWFICGTWLGDTWDVSDMFVCWSALGKLMFQRAQVFWYSDCNEVGYVEFHNRKTSFRLIEIPESI